jgi:hypothetical protein
MLATGENADKMANDLRRRVAAKKKNSAKLLA